MPNGIVEMCIDAKTMAAVQTPALMGKGLKLSRLQLPCPPPPACPSSAVVHEEAGLEQALPQCEHVQVGDVQDDRHQHQQVAGEQPTGLQ